MASPSWRAGDGRDRRDHHQPHRRRRQRRAPAGPAQHDARVHAARAGAAAARLGRQRRIELHATDRRAVAGARLRRVPAQFPRPRRHPPPQRGRVPLQPHRRSGAGRVRRGRTLPGAAAGGGRLFARRQFRAAAGPARARGRLAAAARGRGLPGARPGPDHGGDGKRVRALPPLFPAQMDALAARASANCSRSATPSTTARSRSACVA